MAEPDPVTAKDPFLHREVRKIHRIEPVHLRAGGERKECSAEEHLLPHSAAEEIAANASRAFSNNTQKKKP